MSLKTLEGEGDHRDDAPTGRSEQRRPPIPLPLTRFSCSTRNKKREKKSNEIALATNYAATQRRGELTPCRARKAPRCFLSPRRFHRSIFLLFLPALKCIFILRDSLSRFSSWKTEPTHTQNVYARARVLTLPWTMRTHCKFLAF